MAVLLVAVTGCDRRASTTTAAASKATSPATATPAAPNVPAPAAASSAASPTTAEAPAARAGRDDTTGTEGAASGGSSGAPRMAVNRRLASLALPYFWRSDADGDGKPDASELVRLTSPLAYGVASADEMQARADAIAALQAPAAADKRDAALERELAQGQPTLVETDLRAAPAWERALAEALIAAAAGVEELYALQTGAARLRPGLASASAAARAVFSRNQGPYCEAPLTERDPTCAALSPKPPRVTGLYPDALQADADFCKRLDARPDADALMAPVVAVREGEGDVLVAVPFHRVWPKEHAAVAAALERAAAVLPADEAPFAAYLRAAATAFRDGSWHAADEAWAAMRAENSAFYLRVGPDETYFEPCARKAGYHMSWAKVDKAGLGWKRRLEPLRGALEREVARWAPLPYAAREVAFHLPEFIQIVLNAGDSRSALGATVGQSLPNFGPVAASSRGRTVAMTNLYRDPDSTKTRQGQIASLLCPDAGRLAIERGDSAIVGTVLHEAAHNLGPNGSWRVDGKSDDAIFGGSLAATLEELKAQTLALHLNAWLQGEGKLERAEGVAAWLHDITWAFGHISRGMRSPEGKPKPYAQLAAVQIGRLLGAKALIWRKDAVAFNGVDRGCFSIDLERLPAAVGDLTKDVLAVKVKGDRAMAEALIEPWTRDDGDFAELRATIKARWLRAPKASFVYAVLR